TALPNGTGVILWSAGDNLVGGDHGAAEGNLISGNTGAGVLLQYAGTSGNRIQGNFIGLQPSGAAALGNDTGVEIKAGAAGNLIGTNAAGLGAVPNAHWGVATFGASSCLIGGSSPGEGNLIAGNGADGVGVVAGGGNRVQGNTLGLNAAGNPLPNLWGVYI